jgi:hypothetical protein
MVEWLAGNRIRGTSTERTTTCGFNAISAIPGGWKELGRTTLGSSGDTVTVSSLDDKRYYMVLGDISATGGDTVSHVRANSDSGANYVVRTNINKGSDSQSTGTNRLFTTHDSKSSDSRFILGYIANKSDKEKMGLYQVNENPSTGAGTAPTRIDGIGKHVQTSCALNELQLFNDEAGSFDTNGELVVLGWNPDDTHSCNFWEELSSVDLSGGAASNLSSGTITAKKYLWIQYYVEATSGAPDLQVTFNNDTGSNYARRRSINNGADSTSTSQTSLDQDGSLVRVFVNAFIINNSSNEKLGIFHSVREDSGGAGTAPNRRETAIKWANTSSQITEIDLDVSSSTMTTKSFIKVWGSN